MVARSGFRRLPVGAHIVSGRNKITVKSRPFTIHSELEQVHILGAFRLAAADRGFDILPPIPLVIGAWNAQGWPFYGAAVRYTKTFSVPQGDASFYRLRLGPGWGRQPRFSSAASGLARPPTHLAKSI